MIVSLEEVKEYLKVEHNIEDNTIIVFIKTAITLVEGILRYPVTDFEGDIPEPVRHAVLFIVANMYEKRNEMNMKDILDTVKNLVFLQRKESW